MSGTLNLKKWLAGQAINIPTKSGYGILFIDSDNKIKVKTDDGIITEYGKSAYDIWLDLGNVGTQQEFIDSLKGETGDTGPQGPIGLTGPQGLQGIQGPQGLKGDTGDTGPQGIQGPIGLTGPQGLKGDTGDTGPQGIQGPIGLTGAQGIQGVQGIQGLKGDAGETGAQGIQGPAGQDGQDGEGLIAGGATGQIIAKASNTDFDTEWVNGDDLAREAVGLISKSITGFENRTDSIITYDNNTKILTIAPVDISYTVYLYGKKYVINTPISTEIDLVDGGKYYNIDPTDPLDMVLYDAGYNGGIRDSLLCAYIFYDLANGNAIIVGDERHSATRNPEAHYQQHRNFGCFFRSGGAINYTLNDVNNINVEIATPLVIADEDLEHIINNVPVPELPYQQNLNDPIPVIAYINNAYQQLTDSNTYLFGTNTLLYNPITSVFGSLDSGALEDVGTGYVSYWLTATNDSIQPIKYILGRVVHATIEDALGESFESLGLPMAEIVCMYHVVMYTDASLTNANKCYIAEIRKISERESKSGVPIPANSHDSLIGRELANSHPISAITGLQTELDNISNNLVPSGGLPDQILSTTGWIDLPQQGISIYESDTPPLDPVLNPLWFDTSTAKLKVYFTGASSFIDAVPTVTGPQGPQGIQGPAGNDGAQGIQGIQGPAGNDGAQGIQGIQGPQGLKGDTGDTGPQGIQGPIGLTGPQGIQGPAGNDGAQGIQGIQGPAGQGVPTGGATGQILAKTSATDYATSWIDAPTGGGGDVAQVVLTTSANIGAAQTDKAIIKALNKGTITKLGYVDERGHFNNFENSFEYFTGYTMAIAGTNVALAAGMPDLVAKGSNSIASMALTNIYTKIPKLEFLALSPSSSAIGGFRQQFATFVLNDSTSESRGFRIVIEAGQATGCTNINSRCFVGLTTNINSPTDVDPGSLLNSIGYIYNNTSPNLQILISGSSSINIVDTGIPKPTTDRTDFYQLIIENVRGIITIYIKSLITGVEFHYRAGLTVALTSSNTPINVLLAVNSWCSVGGVSNVVGLALSRICSERFPVDIR